MNSGVRSEFKFWLSPWEACSTSLGLGLSIYKVGILTDSTPAWPLRPSPQLEVSSPSSEPHCSAAPPLGLPGLTLGQAPLLGSGTQRRKELLQSSTSSQASQGDRLRLTNSCQGLSDILHPVFPLMTGGFANSRQAV